MPASIDSGAWLWYHTSDRHIEGENRVVASERYCADQ